MAHQFLGKTMFILCVGAAWFGSVDVSRAQEQLTKAKIEAFHAQSAAVQMLGEAQTVAFFEKHLSDDAHSTVHMITNISGVPPQKTTVENDKKTIISDTKKVYEVGTVDTMESKLLSSEIAPDGRSAKIKDSSYSVMSLIVPTPQGSISMRAEQSMLCDDVLILNADDVIQMTSSICNAEATLTPVE